jgi:isopenicillin N synthase-like dioxygenase
VDFSRYLKGTPEEKRACVDEIMKGFTTSGFLYLLNSGISPKGAYEWSEKFFALPLEEKQKYPNNNSESNRGYSGMGLEKASNLDLESPNAEGIAKLRAMIPDLKESFEIGSDPGRYLEKPFINRYPGALPGFGDAMRDFYSSCDTLHHELLCAIAEGLGLDREYFKEYVTAGDHVLRLLHYPAVPKAVLSQENAVRAGAHTDYGTVTLLFQDGSGGLQVKTPEGKWHDIPPIDGAIVINAADMMQILTNDVIKSTYHRVVSPPNAPTTEDGCYSARYSIAVKTRIDESRIIFETDTDISFLLTQITIVWSTP